MWAEKKRRGSYVSWILDLILGELLNEYFTKHLSIEQNSHQLLGSERFS